MTKTRELTAFPVMGNADLGARVEDNVLRPDYVAPSERTRVVARMRELEEAHPLFRDAPDHVLREFNSLCRRLLELPRGAG